MADMNSLPGGQVHPSDNLFADHRPLPSQADRQKIIEQARLILAAARTLTGQSDRCLALPSAERPAEDTVAAASSSLQRGPQVLFSQLNP